MYETERDKKFDLFRTNNALLRFTAFRHVRGYQSFTAVTGVQIPVGTLHLRFCGGAPWGRHVSPRLAPHVNADPKRSQGLFQGLDGPAEYKTEQ
jgi:hypothetical protein